MQLCYSSQTYITGIIRSYNNIHKIITFIKYTIIIYTVLYSVLYRSTCIRLTHTTLACHQLATVRPTPLHAQIVYTIMSECGSVCVSTCVCLIVYVRVCTRSSDQIQLRNYSDDVHAVTACVSSRRYAMAQLPVSAYSQVALIRALAHFAFESQPHTV